MMKKTLVAVAALAATAAFAQVTITGRVSMGVSNYGASGATAGPAADLQTRTRVDDYSSRLRFAVSEDLGGGTNVFAAYELGLAYDNGQGNSTGNTASSSVAFNGSRESHIGIGNSTGQLRLGKQNVYWTQGDLSEQGSNFIGKDAFSDSYTRIATVRADNAILLRAGKDFGSFEGSEVYYAINTSNESAPAGIPSATQVNNASISGFKLNWDKGAWHAMLDYQARKNNPTVPTGTFELAAVSNITNTVTQAFDATSVKLGLGYRYAERSIIAVHYFDMLKEYADAATNRAPISVGANTFGNGTSGTGGQRQTGYGVTLTHNMGGGFLGYANWGMLNGIQHSAGGADLADSATTMWTLGVRKELSKRTGVFAAAGQINNGNNANMVPSGGGFNSASTPVGADVSFTLVGMMHNF